MTKNNKTFVPALLDSLIGMTGLLDFRTSGLPKRLVFELFRTPLWGSGNIARG